MELGGGHNVRIRTYFRELPTFSLSDRTCPTLEEGVFVFAFRGSYGEDEGSPHLWQHWSLDVVAKSPSMQFQRIMTVRCFDGEARVLNRLYEAQLFPGLPNINVGSCPSSSRPSIRQVLTSVPVPRSSSSRSYNTRHMSTAKCGVSVVH